MLNLSSSSCERLIIWTSSVNSILLSRFLLDLRSVYQADTPALASLPVVSSVRFASTMAGNIGATLDDAWVTGRDRDEVDDDDDEQAQFSEYPFAVGLLDGHNRPDELSLNEKPESS